MRTLLQLIGYHLRNLTRFSGRDARPTFWPWALVLVVSGMAAISAAMLPIMIHMTAAAQRTPGPARIEAGAPGVASGMTWFLLAVAVIAAIVVLLLAASVARRLHDHGRAGAWGLLPLPFLAGGLFLFARIFGSMGDGGAPDGLFFAGALNNLVYLATLAYLIALLLRDGDAGANRYGAPPG